MATTIISPFEPKTTNRFIFYINGLAAFTIKATGLPKLSNGKITLNYMNSTFKVKGLSDWQDINVTLYDPIDPDAAKQVMLWVRQHHLSEIGVDWFAYGPPGVASGILGDIIGGSAPGGILGAPLGYKKNIDLKYVNPKGGEFATWKLFGAFITDVDFGQFDWSESSPLMINMTLAYDWATLI